MVLIGLRRHIVSVASCTRFKFKALSLDAVGTLISLNRPVGRVYKEFAAKHGVEISESETTDRFMKAIKAPSVKGLMSVGDGRDFWKHVVKESTGSEDANMFEELYDYYKAADAWDVAPGAVDVLGTLRGEGVKLVLVSNFDTRLRSILESSGLSGLFEHIVVSAELGVEKPDPAIFQKAVDLVRVPPSAVVHVGNDLEKDVKASKAVGMNSWLWGEDVKSYEEILGKMQQD